MYNAVIAWIHNYAELDGTLAEQYVSLRKKLQFEYEDKLNEQPNNTKTRQRGRPAKRQRTQRASSNPSSTEKDQAT